MAELKIATPREGVFVVDGLRYKQIQPGERGKTTSTSKNKGIYSYPLNEIDKFLNNVAVIEFLRQQEIEEVIFKFKIQSPFGYERCCLNFRDSLGNECFIFLEEHETEGFNSQFCYLSVDSDSATAIKEIVDPKERNKKIEDKLETYKVELFKAK